MVAYKGVTLLHVYGIDIHVAAETGLLQQPLYERIAESDLKLKVGLACPHLLCQHVERHVLKHISHDLCKLCIAEQTLKHLGQFFGLEGSDGVEGLQ